MHKFVRVLDKYEQSTNSGKVVQQLVILTIVTLSKFPNE